VRKILHNILANDRLSFLRSAAMVARPFRSRKPKSSPLWKCFHAHFDRFMTAYPRDYQSRYGVFPEVVDKFMGCGDFAPNVSRVCAATSAAMNTCWHRCCKGRWFCPSCHQKKVQVFGAMLAESILVFLQWGPTHHAVY